jgi:hypothetical protein
LTSLLLSLLASRVLLLSHPLDKHHKRCGR